MLIRVIIINISCRAGSSLHRFNEVNVNLKAGFQSNIVCLANNDQPPELSSKILKYHELCIYTVCYMINDNKNMSTV